MPDEILLTDIAEIRVNLHGPPYVDMIRSWVALACAECLYTYHFYNITALTFSNANRKYRF